VPGGVLAGTRTNDGQAFSPRKPTTTEVFECSGALGAGQRPGRHRRDPGRGPGLLGKRCYAFAYDDVNDQSSVQILGNSNPPDRLTLGIGW